MAIMFPKEEKYLNDKLPFSEREVYRVLSSLSDDYVIFHSVQWVNKNTHHNLLGMKMIFAAE